MWFLTSKLVKEKCEKFDSLYKELSNAILYLAHKHFVASENKLANSQQGNITGQGKNKQNVIL